MNLNVLTMFYLLFLSVGRCCSSKRSTGFISLAFSNVKILATSMDNRSERVYQFKRYKEKETHLRDKDESIRLDAADISILILFSIFLLPIILIFNWLFIGFSFCNLTITYISIWIMAIILSFVYILYALEG
ncbi:hypothetical protein NBO_929g0003 [Nosema bombycis CQ1]|uniref:Uncharacterized protein n=1 Tax=Nosema bombycis (strain CQ1 / CVCC 102059) TaxID=578461 RepID=R0MCC8_NOSB1|nr:hypothetical protein NBO_929g0003 [Nosema bombycis CQ1]|eukprot:EOB11705.1 hypothetical protein NBO_929g0003 [Nosema bombycis CQ1]